MNLFDLKIKTSSFIEKAIGKELATKLMMSYYSNFIKQRNILFIHIPKAAGTSICNILYGRRIGHYSYSEWKKNHHSLVEKVQSFSVVRHPTSRLLSAYYFILYGSKVASVKNKQKFQKDYRFRSFDSFVQEWLVYQTIEKTDRIFQPQYLFICENKKVKVDDVLKIENKEHINTYLSSLLNQEICLSKQNETLMGKKTRLSQVSKSTTDLICDIYREDFRLFGYI